MPRPHASSILRGAYRLVADNLGTYLATQGVLLLLGGVLGAFAGALLAVNLVNAVGAGPSPDSMAGSLVSALVVPLVLLVAVGLFTCVGTFFGIAASADLLQGRRPTLRTLWDDYGAGFGPFLKVLIVVGVLLASLVIAPILLFVLGVVAIDSPAATPVFLVVLLAGILAVLWLALRWWVAPVVAAFEGGTVEAALASSSARLRGGLGPITWVILGIQLPATVLTTLFAAPFEALASAAAPDVMGPAVVTLAGQQLAASLVSLFFGPVISAALVLAYRATEPPAAAGLPTPAPSGAPGATPPSG